MVYISGGEKNIFYLIENEGDKVTKGKKTAVTIAIAGVEPVTFGDTFENEGDTQVPNGGKYV